MTRYELLKSMWIFTQAKSKRKWFIRRWVYINKNILFEIEEDLAQKSKYLYFNPNLATKGRANYLLRKCSKLKKNLKLQKMHCLGFKFYEKCDREEKKEGDNME